MSKKYLVKAPGASQVVRIRTEPGKYEVFVHGTEVDHRDCFAHYPSVFIPLFVEYTIEVAVPVPVENIDITMVVVPPEKKSTKKMKKGKSNA